MLLAFSFRLLLTPSYDLFPEFVLGIRFPANSPWFDERNDIFEGKNLRKYCFYSFYRDLVYFLAGPNIALNPIQRLELVCNSAIT